MKPYIATPSARLVVPAAVPRCPNRAWWPLALLAVGFLLAGGSPVQAATYFWTGTGGNLNWSTPAIGRGVLCQPLRIP